MTIRRILETLAQHRYRLTWQRWAVAAAVVVNQDRLLTAEELYSQLKKDYPDIGLATVYRTLDLLVELGLVDRVQVGEGPTKYGLRNADVEIRQQLVCECCGEVAPLDDRQLESLCKHLSHVSGYQISEIEVRVTGICPRCRAAARGEGQAVGRPAAGTARPAAAAADEPAATPARQAR
ncbi:Fur family transcriptional regulator [Thermaerobacter marianensis]|uniref:Fur family transcriptional regulator n=1 Tax=Thermaerobacter marianensis TaxID=73919 RepID=UPI0002D4F23B|nr:Fur family transcriptional regulator [Thermaerobacter marianensis]